MQNLAKSIEAYERGMELDLNQYYCSGNLPRLYRARKRDGDDERARDGFRDGGRRLRAGRESSACADEWLRATLLGAAFDAADADKAKELAQDVAAEGAAKWKLESTLEDLRTERRAGRRQGDAGSAWPLSSQTWREIEPDRAGPLKPRAASARRAGCRRCLKYSSSSSVSMRQVSGTSVTCVIGAPDLRFAASGAA